MADGGFDNIKKFLTGVGTVSGSVSRAFGIDTQTVINQLKDISNIGGAINLLEKASGSLNESFLLGRGRVLEFKSSISSILPEIRLLGGDLDDVLNMIEQSSQALSRVVIFQRDIYDELFLTSKFLNTDYKTIVTNFSNVGISVANIGTNVEKSINYVKSIGMDAKSVMSSVVNNTDMLNRFSFKEGVLGFTKMAATASMLKVDMMSIQSFADKVFNPEGAIETAAAFQRLGVFTGDLADPFALMNKSLYDPEGLMKNIGRALEVFTELDETSGRITINPSAIGMIKEFADNTNMSASELKKLAINYREFTERKAQINFKFNLSEEQEMLIANMAYMDKKGDYVITLKNESGKDMVTKVSDLTKEQIEKLKEISEKEPKTLIDIAKESMTVTNMINNSVTAIKYRLLFGVAGSQGGINFYEDYVQKGVKPLLKELNSAIDDDFMNPVREKLKNISFDPSNIGASFGKIGDIFSGATSTFQSVIEGLTDTLSALSLSYGDSIPGAGTSSSGVSSGTSGTSGAIGTANNSNTSIIGGISNSSNSSVTPLSIENTQFNQLISSLNKTTDHTLTIIIKKDANTSSISSTSESFTSLYEIDKIKYNYNQNKTSQELILSSDLFRGDG